METLEFRGMNTSVLAAAQEHRLAATGLTRVREFIDLAEHRFSRFVPESELCRLNDSAGGWISVSAELMEILVLAQRYHQETQGLFDPSILPDLVLAGYDKSMDAIRTADRDGASASISRAPERGSGEPRHREPRPTFGDIDLDILHQRVRLPQGISIDLGGIAKGWIVQRAATLLAAFSAPCAVNAGGDMFFVGTPAGGERWSVELEDPLDSSRTIAWLTAAPGAVVTSSVTKRAWLKNGVTGHHIIDPRTGQPAESEWLSVTVLAPDAAAAEAYAKALLIGSRDEARRLQVRHPDLGFVAVDRGGRIYGSHNSREFMNGSVSVHYDA
jgi:thiamine biosynthesis lipoprotein